MRIERVSDTQLKLLLTTKDLSERDLKISDIASNSVKAQKLFKDIMSTAISEFGFAVDESPVMIEAIPTTDGITIIISKVSNDIIENISLIPGALDARKYINSPKTLKSSQEYKNCESNITIFMFDSLDMISNVSSRLSKIYSGTNMVYKYSDKYFLILHTDNYETPVMLADIEILLSEYGKKYISNEISKYYLFEHGEPIIKENAVKILANLM